jgi:hypothetical protein
MESVERIGKQKGNKNRDISSNCSEHVGRHLYSSKLILFTKQIRRPVKQFCQLRELF